DLLEQRSTPWLAAHAQALALTGSWEAARALAAELERRTRPDENGAPENRTTEDASTETKAAHDDAARQLASTRLVLQDPGSAWSLASARADDAGASIQDLMLGAQIARLLGNPDA